MAATAKDLRYAPKTAKGKGVKEALGARLYKAKSDSFVYSDSSPALLFNVKSGTMIHDLILNVETAFAKTGGAGTLIAGIAADTDMFYADTTQCAVGTYSMHGAGALNSGIYVATGDVTVQASWVTASTTGGGHAYLIYSYANTDYVNP